MATYSGSLPTYTVNSTGDVTWNIKVSYVVTPSTDLTSHSVELTVKANRDGWGTSYNTNETDSDSYFYYTVNGNKSAQKYVPFEVTGGEGDVTIDTYTYNVSSNSIDFSSGIPIKVEWYTGIVNNEYTLAKFTVTGSITVPEEYIGLVYIDNGSSWDVYMVYIDNGSSWDRYIPYIDNGSSWDMCS